MSTAPPTKRRRDGSPDTPAGDASSSSSVPEPADAATSATGDLLTGLLDRGLDHVVQNIMETLDFVSLRRCLWVNCAWRHFVSSNAAALRFEAKEMEYHYVEKKCSQSAFVPLPANWANRLTDKPTSKGRKLCLSDLTRRELLAHEYPPRKDFPPDFWCLPSHDDDLLCTALCPDERHLFMFYAKVRMLVDLKPKEKMWVQENKKLGETFLDPLDGEAVSMKYCDFRALRGDGFVGVWNPAELILFSLEDGSIIFEDRLPLSLVTANKSTILAMKRTWSFEGDDDSWGCRDTSCRVYKIRPGTSDISWKDLELAHVEDRWVRDSRVEYSKISLEGERFLVGCRIQTDAENTSDPDERFNYPEGFFINFAIWDLSTSEMVVPKPWETPEIPRRKIVPYYFEPKFMSRLGCVGLVEGCWILQLFEEAYSSGAQRPLEEETPIRCYLLAFNKSLSLLRDLKLEPFTLKNLFRTVDTRDRSIHI